MSDLSSTFLCDVSARGRLRLTGEDLAEVTHRLNAMRDALAPLGALPLEHVTPAPPAADA